MTNVEPGQSFPLGATVREGGVNFSVFSRNATSVELLLFEDADAGRPSRRIILDPRRNRTYYYWHVFVPGLQAGQLYGYRVHGPFQPERGHRFDASKLLLDPYARAVAVGRRYDREAAIGPGDNAAYAMKGVVVDPSTYDWEGDQPLCRPYARTVIYEMHVGGFTRHPSSGLPDRLRGTYAGLVEKIPYLKDLGITAVELLPVQHFDEQDVKPPLRNYWGYNPVAFFAPHSGYSSETSPLGPVNEFRDMVKALHAAGIEVILDVVFNHTAEGDHRGPTLGLRGFENVAYYLLEPDRRFYANYSGCGNTLNANHSVVRRLILDCLRYWVSEMHVDGFRFDLASVLARDERGRPLENPPVLWSIESDPVLAGTKIIAEAWDAAGLYLVGTFVGHRWAEWNGPYRDDVRRFFRGDPGMVGPVAARLTGSPDLFDREGRDPNRSINFITCHDGFTLNDLVSYNAKHNEANGEDNRDGTDANYSWNGGVEGPTDDPAVEALRIRQIKNFFTTLFVSQGTPMFLMGDEVRRTQHGNNNAYCQDNEISWFDWRCVEREADLRRFVKGLIRLNLTHRAFQQERFWIDGGDDGDVRIVWHGVSLHEPDWSPDSHTLAFTLEDGDHLHVILNAYWEPLPFALPPLPPPHRWHRLVDTGRPSPEDLCSEEQAPPVQEATYLAAPRSVVVLIAR
ncbi:MAG: glycogen operon protein GlgX homolog [Rhodothermaceae bacterium]|nr:MAG: glycogen operon protein GlgX homolog [Rhodothermaceae bacterium]